MEDGSVSWVELETGNEVEAPSGTSTIDGETFSVADRSVSIEDPDWSDVNTTRQAARSHHSIFQSWWSARVAGRFFDSRWGAKIDHMWTSTISTAAGWLSLAQPQEPALPPSTVWIIDLECADCTQVVETPGPEYFDLIGVLPQEDGMVQPALP